MPKQKYLVTVSFNTGVNTIYQYYITDRKAQKILKELEYEKEGTCCSQGGCFACRVGGYTVSFHDSVRISLETEELLQQTIKPQILSLPDLIYSVEEQ